jgi:hypothetical protein
MKIWVTVVTTGQFVNIPHIFQLIGTARLITGKLQAMLVSVLLYYCITQVVIA